ncbi:MAG: hypothetical protein P1P90_03250 [Patescibacteria group bacterium]|nr:hypothetical protein [Patescibacteria group bacterium]
MNAIDMLSMFFPLSIFIIFIMLIVGLVYLLRDDNDFKSMQMSKTQIIKTVYFYLVSLIALMMVVFSTADLVNLGLKTWVFPKADLNEYRDPPCAFMIPKEPDDADYQTRIAECEKNQLSEDEMRAIRNQKSAVRDLSFLFVGIPLFLYYWVIIRKEQKKD